MTDRPENLSARALLWKYFEPHPWWPEGRSYMLTTPAGIAAHGCAAPVRYQGNVESLQVIDWAAGRLVPGAGLLVYRKCLEVNKGTLLAIGGGEDTLKIIPMVKWFSRKDDLRSYARPLRPWRHFAQGSKNVRNMGRLLRNVQWKLAPALPASRSWQCRPARAGEEVFNPSDSAGYVPIVRTRAWFDYLLRCPIAAMELVMLEDAGRPVGHALLSNVHGSVRVADFVVTSGAPDAAFAALVRYVSQQPAAAEIVAASSLAETNRVFEVCGLRFRGAVPVYLADPRKLLPADKAIEITAAIGDAFYLGSPEQPFVC